MTLPQVTSNSNLYYCKLSNTISCIDQHFFLFLAVSSNGSHSFCSSLSFDIHAMQLAQQKVPPKLEISIFESGNPFRPRHKCACFDMIIIFFSRTQTNRPVLGVYGGETRRCNIYLPLIMCTSVWSLYQRSTVISYAMYIKLFSFSNFTKVT